jgi:membrane protein implicated in regulation of membrane protease activity
VTPDRRRAILRIARGITGTFAAIVIGACIAVAYVPVWAAVVGTLACAVVACSAFYAAFEGFDERLRRGP